MKNSSAGQLLLPRSINSLVKIKKMGNSVEKDTLIFWNQASMSLIQGFGLLKKIRSCMKSMNSMVPSGHCSQSFSLLSKTPKIFRSENSIKNRFYGNLRKLARKLNKIGKENLKLKKMLKYESVVKPLEARYAQDNPGLSKLTTINSSFSTLLEVLSH